jgi:FkbM family methyltransferase
MSEPITTPHGRFVPFEGKDYVFDHLASDGYWEYHNVLFLAEHCNPNAVAIDVGAYFGFHTVCMAHKAKWVYTFEPQEVIFRKLLSNIALNSLTNVTAMNMACYSRETTLQLAPEKIEGMGHVKFNPDGSIDYLRSTNAAATAYKVGPGLVKAVRLDSIVKEPVSVVKIDAQGSDCDVLRGADGLTEAYRPFYVVEDDPGLGGLDRNKIQEFCQMFNYVAERIGKSKDWSLLPK